MHCIYELRKKTEILYNQAHDWFLVSAFNECSLSFCFWARLMSNFANRFYQIALKSELNANPSDEPIESRDSNEGCEEGSHSSRMRPFQGATVTPGTIENQPNQPMGVQLNEGYDYTE